MNHNPERRVDCERNAIYKAMCYLNRMNGERSDLDALPWPYLPEVCFIKQSVFIQLVFHVSQCELGSPYRNVQLREHPRQSSDVVFMSMREHNPAYPLTVFE